MREYHDRILKHKGDLLYFTLKFWFHLIAYKSTISLSVDQGGGLGWVVRGRESK